VTILDWALIIAIVFLAFRGDSHERRISRLEHRRQPIAWHCSCGKFNDPRDIHCPNCGTPQP